MVLEGNTVIVSEPGAAHQRVSFKPTAPTKTSVTVIGSVLLVLIAYLPTLQFDYAVRDQWRAFAAPESVARFDEMVACSRGALPFYVRSGRPLVWVGECVERALVSDIRQFWYLRLISLAIVLATSLYLAGCLSKTIGLEAALFAATVFVLLPGFIFMTELGMNGAPVVLAVTAAVASLSQLNRSVFATRTGPGVVCRRSATALALFVIACFLYPAWAFIVVPLVLIQSGLAEAESITVKFRNCCRLLSFYASATLAYFVLVKLMVWIDLFGSAHINMGDGRYEVSPNVNAAALSARLVRAMSYVFDGYLWDLRVKTTLMTAGVIAFGILVWFRTSTRYKYGVPIRLLIVAVAALAGFTSIGFSMAPWLLSGMQEAHERFFVPAYLLPIVSIFTAAAAVVGRVTPNGRLWPSVGLCMCLVAAFAVNKVTHLDVTASVIRTDFVRQRVNDWLNRRGYETERLLLLVPPYGNNSEPRPAFIRRLLVDPDRTDTGKWSGDPNHYFDVVSAILRERRDHPLGRSIGIINCGLNKTCTEKNLEQGEAVFALLSEPEANQGYAAVPGPYALINMSDLTANPIRPTLEVIRH
jgi:hypothetical protein